MIRNYKVWDKDGNDIGEVAIDLGRKDIPQFIEQGLFDEESNVTSKWLSENIILVLWEQCIIYILIVKECV